MSNFKFTTLTYKTDKTIMNSHQKQQQQQQQQSQSNQNQNASSKLTSTSKQSHQPFDTTSSILSDYDDLMDEEIDDNSSYVVFNPLKKNINNKSLPPSHQNESDILSLTNTSNTNSHTRNQYHYIDEEDADEEEEEEEEEEDVETEGELDDEIQHTVDAITEAVNDTTTPQTNTLSNKINNWYNSSITDHHNHIIDDNIASWNLDENLIQDSISSNNTLSFTSSSNDSDQHQQQQLIIKQFYGDELFQYFTPQDLEKFKHFNKLIDIKKFLLEKDNNSSSSIITQILNLLLLKNHTVLTNHNDNKQVDENDLTQYIQQIKNANQKHATHTHHNVDDVYVRPSTFSETTNSSLIMCGGVGFGGGSSWNDV
ncbi:hypothetical protein DFJ63DRAFT_320320 [Scheffersomyces coipomensis]|uniref:uncharacterized protein n=1 Tax=Scheffersomyces coipomensis TaxID=1788519 RepID=UPI00315DBE84